MADEPVTVAKWVVAVLLTLSLIGVVFILFNLTTTSYNARVDKMRQAAASHTADRLWELVEDSQRHNPTSVPNAVSMLREFKDDVLLYITVVDDEANIKTFVPKVYKPSVTVANAGEAATALVECEDDTIEKVSKYMLQYAGHRCYTQIIGYKYSSGAFTIKGGSTVSAPSVSNNYVTDAYANEAVQEKGVASGGSYDAIAFAFYITEMD